MMFDIFTKFKASSNPVTFWLVLILMLLVRCREEYNPPPVTASYNYLVVDGFINLGNEPTTFQLSRTLKLVDSIPYKPETGALMSIEGDDGFFSSLQEGFWGSYSGGPFNLNSSAKYRVHIKTTDGKEFYSDFITIHVTPPIDSIGWQRNSEGVQIYANTHDQANNARYYRWTYEQTWKFHSAFASSLEYQNGFLVPRLDYDAIYTCWHSENSTDLLVGSSEGLSENVIYKHPIIFIPEDSWPISVKYSILVKQQALDKETYNYLLALKRITEQAGTIFDPQPSTMPGNIHCMNDPKEVVLGYVYSSSVTEKRIFIDNSELPDWVYQSGCYTFYASGSGDLELVAAGYYIPIAQNNMGLKLTDEICGNCTLRGTHQKPDFWP